MTTWTNKKVWFVLVGVLAFGLLIDAAIAAYTVREYSCNTIVLDVKGDLVTSYATAGVSDDAMGYVTYSDWFAKTVELTEKSKTVKAIIIDIDSYGGLPVAGEEIANALKRTEKKNVALIRTAGLSSAYWAASGADRIIASRNSDVGSIGVSLQLRNFVEKNKKEGIRVTSITSGQYKGIGDPNRELTDDEKKMLQEDVDKIHENFVSAISENRGLPKEDVSKLATGESMLGEEALDGKLIDAIGDLADAKAYLAKELGEEVRICMPPAAESGS